MDYKNHISKIVKGGALLLCLALLAGGAAFYEARQNRKDVRRYKKAEEKTGTPWTIENTVAFDSEIYGFNHRIESFLFLGTDNNASAPDSEEEVHGAMADFLLLMVLDYTDDTYGCLQIDRNTITQVEALDEKGEVTNFRDIQICVSHWYGTDGDMNARNTDQAVRYLLGELNHIDGYYVLNMEDVGQLNHAVGGVSVTFQEDLTPSDPAFVKGATLTLSDEQAARFVRSRMILSDDTNVARMSRQKQYMDSLIDRVRERSASNPGFALELWDTLRSTAVTNMNGNDFSRIAQMFLRGDNKGILRLEGKTKIGTVLNDGEEHEEFYPEAGSVLSCMTELYSLIPVDFEDVKY